MNKINMKEDLLNTLYDYLLIFPKEKTRQTKLLNYLQNSTDEQVVDWNNFNGHIVASGFIYAKKEKKFLLLYHKDLNMYLYPGGHINSDDINVLEAAKREIFEETGLKNIEQLKLSKNELLPLDIDIHLISYNKRLNLPEHYHFDFRYLFMVDKIPKIKIDVKEHANYKWVDLNDLSKNENYGTIVTKIKKLL